MKEDDRRLKVFWVDESDILGLLLNGARLSNKRKVAVTLFPQLPDGYSVLTVHHEWQQRAFGFIIQHPDFAVVPVGHTLPHFYYKDEVTYVAVAPAVEVGQ